MTKTENERTLGDFSGTLVLIGAGRMGSALLDGWLQLGLDPTRIAVLEPEPTAQVSALTSRGLRLNPPPNAVGEVDAMVVAIKPQVAAEVLPGVTPLVGAPTLVL